MGSQKLYFRWFHCWKRLCPHCSSLYMVLTPLLSPRLSHRTEDFGPQLSRIHSPRAINCLAALFLFAPWSLLPLFCCFSQTTRSRSLLRSLTTAPAPPPQPSIQSTCSVTRGQPDVEIPVSHVRSRKVGNCLVISFQPGREDCREGRGCSYPVGVQHVRKC